MACEIRYVGPFTTRRQEDHDVPRQHNGVRGVPEAWHLRLGRLNRCEITLIPGERVGFATCHSKHGSVETDPYDIDITARQLHSHSACTTPGIEHGRYPERRDKMRFTMHIL